MDLRERAHEAYVEAERVKDEERERAADLARAQRARKIAEALNLYLLDIPVPRAMECAQRVAGDHVLVIIDGLAFDEHDGALILRGFDCELCGQVAVGEEVRELAHVGRAISRHENDRAHLAEAFA